MSGSLRKALLLLISVTLLVLVIAGCGSNSATSTNTSSSSSSGISLSDLKSGEKTLVVGTDATFPPFEYTDPSGNKIGFDIDLVNAIMKNIGVKNVEFKQVPFDELVPDLTANHIDMAASAIYITAAREKVVNFSQTYFPGGLCIMVNKSNSSIHGLSDLAGKRVAVQVGTKSVDWLKSKMPSAKLVIVQTNDQMFQSVQNGQADAVVTGFPAASYYIKIHGGAKIVGPQITSENYGFAFRKSDTDLLNAVNQSLDQLKQDGTLKQLETRWFGGEQ